MRRVVVVAFLILCLALTGCPSVVSDSTGLVMDGTTLVYKEPLHRPILYAYGSVKGTQVKSRYCATPREGETPQVKRQAEPERNCELDDDGWADLDLPQMEEGAYPSQVVLGQLQSPPERAFICVTVKDRRESACTDDLESGL